MNKNIHSLFWVIEVYIIILCLPLRKEITFKKGRIFDFQLAAIGANTFKM